jgi:hypothetical protein
MEQTKELPFTDPTIFVDRTVKPAVQLEPIRTAEMLPVPANYLCVICMKPGHLRSQCPESVSSFKRMPLLVWLVDHNLIRKKGQFGS